MYEPVRTPIVKKKNIIRSVIKGPKMRNMTRASKKKNENRHEPNTTKRLLN